MVGGCEVGGGRSVGDGATVSFRALLSSSLSARGGDSDLAQESMGQQRALVQAKGSVMAQETYLSC